MKLEPRWEFVSDQVMGGVSCGCVKTDETENRLTGNISLENNGGFVQMAFDLSDDGGPFDASEFAGLEIDLRGNQETYDLRLRTSQLTRPWQSFRTSFVAPRDWQSIRFPFSGFKPHRTDARFEPACLRRVGILGIGRQFQADVCVRTVLLYR